MATTDMIHYAPGDRPLCGAESWTASYTSEVDQVAGCADCLELVAEDLADDNEYLGRCLHCRQEITATGGVEWGGVWSVRPARTAGEQDGKRLRDAIVYAIMGFDYQTPPV